MQIFIGSHPFTVSDNETVGDVCARVAAQMNVAGLSLVFGGRILAEETLLAEAGIMAGSFLDMTLPIFGAGKDKKKKKRTHKTPKKISQDLKRRTAEYKSSRKLAVLKYYSVKGDSIESLRDFCPKCGAGVRMARHANRIHCGKCGNASL